MRLRECDPLILVCSLVALRHMKWLLMLEEDEIERFRISCKIVEDGFDACETANGGGCACGAGEEGYGFKG